MEELELTNKAKKEISDELKRISREKEAQGKELQMAQDQVVDLQERNKLLLEDSSAQVNALTGESK